MRLEAAAALFLTLTVGLVIIAVISLNFWDSFVDPFIEITGAYISMASLPAVVATFIVVIGSLVYRMRHPR